MFDFITRLTSSDAHMALLWGRGAEPQKYNKSYDPSEWHSMPITESRVSGDVRFFWKFDCDYDAEGMPDHTDLSYSETSYMIRYRDVQYKGNRFLFLANGMPRQEIVDFYSFPVGAGHTDGTIVSRLSGFPTSASDREQLKVTDILTDEVREISATGTIDVTIKPTTVVILKVEPADGYCGGSL